jgi:hypothetical protein
MITEVFEEVSILGETFVEPNKLARLEIGVRLQVSGFAHSPSVSAIGDRIHGIPNDDRVAIVDQRV